ncbi:MAG: hypothetical protein L0Y76_12125 [Ignavibacteria bacterium]|nr:hypothetical protein [Ignavibacteria bacterium]
MTRRQAEILQFIEFSGGVSPSYLPKSSLKHIPFPKIPQAPKKLDLPDKILIALGALIFIAIIVGIIYYYEKKHEKEIKERMKRKNFQITVPKSHSI